MKGSQRIPGLSAGLIAALAAASWGTTYNIGTTTVDNGILTDIESGRFTKHGHGNFDFFWCPVRCSAIHQKIKQPQHQL